MEGLFVLGPVSWRDGVDFALLYLLSYAGLRLVRRTRALPVALAFGALGLLALVVQRADLIATATLLRYFFDSFVLLLIVVFHPELRRGLLLLGQRLLPHPSAAVKTTVAQDVVTAVDRMIRGGIGAMVVLQGRIDVAEAASDPGRPLDVPLRADVLVALVVPHAANLAHDGAVVVDRDRILRAGVIGPLTRRTDLDPTFGTRHRGAIGLSEDTDALVVVVSEERGEVRVAQRGEISDPLTLASLQDRIDGFLRNRSGPEAGAAGADRAPPSEPRESAAPGGGARGPGRAGARPAPAVDRGGGDSMAAEGEG